VRRIASAAIFLCLAASAGAQQTQYISDEIFVWLRAGAGNNYKLENRVTPGTPMNVLEISDDGEWKRVSTQRGTEGWIEARYLTDEPPAQVQLPQAERALANAEKRLAEAEQSLAETRAELASLQSVQTDTAAQLDTVSGELSDLQQISGNAVQLDLDNRRLVEEAETLRAELEILESDNQRLQEKLTSSAFIDGALAVGLGVIITLVVPRLWPKRRRSSSWA
jgi:SH3 domain protein